MACDGLWDVFSSEAAVEHIRKLYAAGEHDIALIAEDVLDEALERGTLSFSMKIFITYSLVGSKDNISSVIVQLPGAVLGARDNVVEKKRDAKPKAAEEERNGDGSKDYEED